MPTTPNWKSILEFGASITEPRRKQAREIVAGLVASGQVGREQAGSAVEEVLAIGRKRTEEISVMVRREVEKQLRSLGIVKAPASKPAAKKPAAKKPAAKKPAAKKPAAKKPAVKKTAAKKPATNKAAAKKPAAKKAATKKTAAKSTKSK